MPKSPMRISTWSFHCFLTLRHLTTLICFPGWTSCLGCRNHLLVHIGTIACTRQILLCGVGYPIYGNTTMRNYISFFLYLIIARNIATINHSNDMKVAGLDLFCLCCSPSLTEWPTLFHSCLTTGIDPVFLPQSGHFQDLQAFSSRAHFLLAIFKLRPKA